MSTDNINVRRIIYKVVVKDAEKVVAETLAYIYLHVSCELLSFMRSLFQAAHVQRELWALRRCQCS